MQAQIGHEAYENGFLACGKVSELGNCGPYVTTLTLLDAPVIGVAGPACSTFPADQGASASVVNRSALRPARLARGGNASALIGLTPSAASLGQRAVSARQDAAAPVGRRSTGCAEIAAGEGRARTRPTTIRSATATERPELASAARERAAAPIGQRSAVGSCHRTSQQAAFASIGCALGGARQWAGARSAQDGVLTTVVHDAALRAEIGASLWCAPALMGSAAAAARVRRDAGAAVKRPTAPVGDGSAGNSLRGASRGGASALMGIAAAAAGRWCAAFPRAVECGSAAIGRLAAIRSQGRASRGNAWVRSALVRAPPATVRLRRRTVAAVERASASIRKRSAVRACGRAVGGFAFTLAGVAHRSTNLGRDATAAVQGVAAPIGDLAALDAELGAGRRSAATPFGDPASAAGIGRCAGAARDRARTRIRDRAACGSHVRTGDRRACQTLTATIAPAAAAHSGLAGAAIYGGVAPVRNVATLRSEIGAGERDAVERQRRVASKVAWSGVDCEIVFLAGRVVGRASRRCRAFWGRVRLRCLGADRYVPGEVVAARERAGRAVRNGEQQDATSYANEPAQNVPTIWSDTPPSVGPATSAVSLAWSVRRSRK